MEEAKIIIRPIEPADVNFMLMVENNQSNWHVSETMAPFSKFLIEEYLRTSQDIYMNKQIRFIIENESNHEKVGLLDFFDFSPRNRRAGIGIIVLEEFQRKGFAKEALTLALEYAKKIDLHQVHCSIGADNTKSLKLFDQLSFVETGLKRDWRYFAGKWHDEIDLQIILE